MYTSYIQGDILFKFLIIKIKKQSKSGNILKFMNFYNPIP